MNKGDSIKPKEVTIFLRVSEFNMRELNQERYRLGHKPHGHPCSFLLRHFQSI